VLHLLDCDGSPAGCDLDLDIYINGNFDPEGLRDLRRSTLTQGLWGNEKVRSHTVPNLLREMDAMRVRHSLILPIKVGLPFGDRLTEHWRAAVARAGATDRLHVGLSVYPTDPDAPEQLRRHASSGARVMKLHPTVQQFYPDDPALFPLYEEAQSLGIVVFFHGGRAGIEPQDRLRYAVPRHYEAVLARFPDLQVVLGHAGARDSAAMLELALRYANAWLGIHGQSVTSLDRIIDATAGERLLFGTDWPWYHLGATLAKVLLCTDGAGREPVRRAILRDNALRLLPELERA
jgi:predicted TIM-barrel fold metal-dependent hydrolase